MPPTITDQILESAEYIVPHGHCAEFGESHSKEGDNLHIASTVPRTKAAVAQARKANAYNEEVSVRGSQLEALGLGRVNLSDTGRHDLETIASVVEKIGLTTGNEAAILRSVVLVHKQLWELEDSEDYAEALRRRLQCQMQIIQQNTEALKDVAKETAGSQTHQLAEIPDRMQRKVRAEMKANSYIEELSSLQANLRKAGFTPELRHEKLKARHNALIKTQERIKALQSTLNFYKGLPADTDAARLLVKEKHQQLHEVTQQFHDGVAQL